MKQVLEANMPVDFRDAAERHYEDAGYLLTGNRLADADHLFGLSGECALKTVMLSLGMALRPDVNQRYHHRSGITSEVIEKHRQTAIQTRQVLETAVLNGDVI